MLDSTMELSAYKQMQQRQCYTELLPFPWLAWLASFITKRGARRMGEKREYMVVSNNVPLQSKISLSVARPCRSQSYPSCWNRRRYNPTPWTSWWTAWTCSCMQYSLSSVHTPSNIDNTNKRLLYAHSFVSTLKYEKHWMVVDTGWTLIKLAFHCTHNTSIHPHTNSPN